MAIIMALSSEYAHVCFDSKQNSLLLSVVTMTRVLPFFVVSSKPAPKGETVALK